MVRDNKEGGGWVGQGDNVLLAVNILTYTGGWRV